MLKRTFTIHTNRIVIQPHIYGKSQYIWFILPIKGINTVIVNFEQIISVISSLKLKDFD
jgi:hypothetical protein